MLEIPCLRRSNTRSLGSLLPRRLLSICVYRTTSPVETIESPVCGFRSHGWEAACDVPSESSLWGVDVRAKGSWDSFVSLGGDLEAREGQGHVSATHTVARRLHCSAQPTTHAAGGVAARAGLWLRGGDPQHCCKQNPPVCLPVWEGPGGASGHPHCGIRKVL